MGQKRGAKMAAEMGSKRGQKRVSEKALKNGSEMHPKKQSLFENVKKIENFLIFFSDFFFKNPAKPRPQRGFVIQQTQNSVRYAANSRFSLFSRNKSLSFTQLNVLFALSEIFMPMPRFGIFLLFMEVELTRR